MMVCDHDARRSFVFGGLEIMSVRTVYRSPDRQAGTNSPSVASNKWIVAEWPTLVLVSCNAADTRARTFDLGANDNGRG